MVLRISLYGSPPHTWGIQVRIASSYTRLRFTPTHVGNTTLLLSLIGNRAVHPHTRGEYENRVWDELTKRGSPPHTWGIHFIVASYPLSRRFTPTHVGNTTALLRIPLCTTVHPHTRGEYGSLSGCASWAYGSPPHTWGIRQSVKLTFLRLRFTPTHVGNTS